MRRLNQAAMWGSCSWSPCRRGYAAVSCRRRFWARRGRRAFGGLAPRAQRGATVSRGRRAGSVARVPSLPGCRRAPRITTCHLHRPGTRAEDPCLLSPALGPRTTTRRRTRSLQRCLAPPADSGRIANAPWSDCPLSTRACPDCVGTGTGLMADNGAHKRPGTKAPCGNVPW